jgi:hypothetical protein
MIGYDTWYTRPDEEIHEAGSGGWVGEWVSKGCAGEIECSSWMDVWDIWRMVELRRKGMWAPDEVP